MSVLVACEASQEVCIAFRRLGAEAYSCDIECCYGGHPEWHILGDARIAVKGGCSMMLESGAQLLLPSRWDLVIAHPPCTMLTHASAVRYVSGEHTDKDIEEARGFFMEMYNANADCVAVENPAPLKRAALPPYDQIIQPYMFGEKYSKRICLWLRNLPPIFPTLGYSDVHVPWLKHCSGNARRRSKTFPKVAQVLAENWIKYAG